MVTLIKLLHLIIPMPRVNLARYSIDNDPVYVFTFSIRWLGYAFMLMLSLGDISAHYQED